MPQERKFFNELSKRQKVRHLKNFTFPKEVEGTNLGKNSENQFLMPSSETLNNAEASCSHWRQNETHQMIDDCPSPTDPDDILDQEMIHSPTVSTLNHEIIIDEHARDDILSVATVLPSALPPSTTLASDLRSWVVENSVAHNLVNSLLVILHKHIDKDQHPLPLDVRTLLGTPRTVDGIVDVSPGFYMHFGIAQSLSHNIAKYYSVHDVPDNILLNINIDGLPLAKSSGSQFWPILGSISTNFYTVPFIIGCYHGYHKPHNPNEFLQSFVSEMKFIEEHGISFFTKNIGVKLNAIICDSPARAYVCCVKGHNAYFGCSKCITEGEYVDGRVTYPQTDAPLRTNESFNNKQQIEHHKEAITSNLTSLDMGMVTNIPLDYMHLCCLGVMKRLLQLWCRGPKNIKMNKGELLKFSSNYMNMKQFIPKEFARKPRAIEELDRFKATEFRQILLYTGIVVLKDTLRLDQYIHYLCLSLAIRILVSQQYHQVLNDYAESLLKYFVNNFSLLYGACNVSFNVHNLIHIASDAKLLGPLDSFSAFKFENYMQTILKKIKVSREPLKQLCNRVSEEYKNSKIQPNQHQSEVTFPMLVYSKKQTSLLAHLKYSEFILSTNKVPSDNTCLLKDGNNSRFISIRSFCEENNNIIIKADVYQNQESLFQTPCDSTNFDIVVIDNMVYEPISLTISELTSKLRCKCMKLPLDTNKSVIIPLIHHNEK